MASESRGSTGPGNTGPGSPTAVPGGVAGVSGGPSGVDTGVGTGTVTSGSTTTTATAENTATLGGLPNVARRQRFVVNKQTEDERKQQLEKETKASADDINKMFEPEAVPAIDVEDSKFTEKTNAAKGEVTKGNDVIVGYDSETYTTGTYDTLMGITRGSQGEIEKQDVPNPDKKVGGNIKVKYKNPNNLDLDDIRARGLEEAIFTKELRESYTKCMIITIGEVSLTSNPYFNELRHSSTVILPAQMVVELLDEGAILYGHATENGKTTLRRLVYSRVIDPKGAIVSVEMEQKKLKELKEATLPKIKEAKLNEIKAIMAEVKKEATGDLPYEKVQELKHRLEAVKFLIHSFEEEYGNKVQEMVEYIKEYNKEVEAFYKKY